MEGHGGTTTFTDNLNFSLSFSYLKSYFLKSKQDNMVNKAYSPAKVLIIFCLCLLGQQDITVSAKRMKCK